MEFNRNQYFLAGLVIFVLGIQLRMVEGFVLNERATQILHQRLNGGRGPTLASAGDEAALMAATGLAPNHRVTPPKWLGWSLVSFGSVLILYSLVLKKPGG
jgi:hypothetical protein